MTDNKTPRICGECNEPMTPFMNQIETDQETIEVPSGFVVCKNGHSEMA